MAIAEPTLRLRGRPDAAQEVSERARALGLHPVAVELLGRRGILEEHEQRRALSPRLVDLRPPEAMAGFSAALELLAHARERGVRVGVFGDYDVDGVTTAAILAGFLRALGMEVVSKVAARADGYGFVPAAARDLAAAGVGLVLTGDTGTSDHEALGWLRGRGISTVVIDHHQVPDTMPPTDALINPHQAGCGFSFKGLCSAGVAFYLAAALRTRLRRYAPSAPLPDPRAWLDLAAVGTICDMVPLRDENRILVRHGLALMGARRRPGLRALLQRARVAADEPIDEAHVAFRIGPRINAPGRLAAADPALRLLLAANGAEAGPLAAEVETWNEKRRAAQDRVLEQAAAQLDAAPALRAGLVLWSEAWEPGIVGIAAAGVVERTGRPALVLAVDQATGRARGSARSVPGIDVRAAIADCAELLDRFGGHPQAAGVSLPGANLPALADAFDRAVARRVAESTAPVGGLEHDGELAFERLDPALVSAVRALAPFGVGFPAPCFVAQATVVRARVVKERHVSLVLRQGAREVSGIAFRQAELGIREGERIGLAYEPTVRTSGGRSSIELLVGRMWRA
jgi:single-stranded-DNA-specific exonuclease